MAKALRKVVGKKTDPKRDSLRSKTPWEFAHKDKVKVAKNDHGSEHEKNFKADYVSVYDREKDNYGYEPEPASNDGYSGGAGPVESVDISKGLDEMGVNWNPNRAKKTPAKEVGAHVSHRMGGAGRKARGTELASAFGGEATPKSTGAGMKSGMKKAGKKAVSSKYGGKMSAGMGKSYGQKPSMTYQMGTASSKTTGEPKKGFTAWRAKMKYNKYNAVHLHQQVELDDETLIRLDEVMELLKKLPDYSRMVYKKTARMLNKKKARDMMDQTEYEGEQIDELENLRNVSFGKKAGETGSRNKAKAKAAMWDRVHNTQRTQNKSLRTTMNVHPNAHPSDPYQRSGEHDLKSGPKPQKKGPHGIMRAGHYEETEID